MARARTALAAVQSTTRARDGGNASHSARARSRATQPSSRRIPRRAGRQFHHTRLLHARLRGSPGASSRTGARVTAPRTERPKAPSFLRPVLALLAGLGIFVVIVFLGT